MEDIMELSTHVNDNLLRLNIAGCRKTMTDAGEILYDISICNFDFALNNN